MTPAFCKISIIIVTRIVTKNQKSLNDGLCKESHRGSTPLASTMQYPSFVYRTKEGYCNDIRSVPERVIYASHMISPSGVIYACGV